MIIVRSQFKRWKWKFARKHVYFLPFVVDTEEPLRLLSETGRELVSVKGDKCVIERHYHFDGATWAPDFRKVLLPCALHDALLQVQKKYPGEITDKQVHKAFCIEMRLAHFKLWLVYAFFTHPLFRRVFIKTTHEK